MTTVTEKIVHSNCRGCHGGCGVLVHVRDGADADRPSAASVITRIEGDPDFPTNRGSMCSKGLAFAQLVYHPDRLKYPVKRAGARGEGKWERITWDEALDTIADRISRVKAENGAESVVLGYGTGRNYEAFLYRFANLFGTPNVITAGHMCYGPRIAATSITCGRLPVCDYAGKPRLVMVWGNNVVWTNADEYKGTDLSMALSNGAKLIVVDPRLTYLAGRADIWLQLRPGTDTALALGMANVIINEGLYDRAFVEKYVHGWDKFVERVNQYSPERVAEITWVPVEKIRAAARLYAQTKPAAIQWGVAIEQTINCTDNNRTLNDLMAITGNLDVPGGNVFFGAPPTLTTSQFALHRDLPAPQREKRLGNQFKLADRIAIVTPKACWDAILTGKPYPVRALMLHGTNPVMTRANAREVYAALQKVEFLSVADFFPTPTAELADIVLPASTWLEFDDIGNFIFRNGWLAARPAIAQVGECWPDHLMFMEFGRRLGQSEQWRGIEGDLDNILEPSGLHWPEFLKAGILYGKTEYRKHEKKGFPTPTGKVELYSTIMEQWGYDPLPQFREVPESPISRPDLAKQYPYVLITGARTPTFFHSEHRMVPWLREAHPDPLVEMHPDTAAKHGIKDGDWVWIEGPRGRVRQRARITTGIDPRVIAAEHAWWYPEDKDDPGHGWDRSNINVLTDNALSGHDPAMGATNLRVMLCRVYPTQ